MSPGTTSPQEPRSPEGSAEAEVQEAERNREAARLWISGLEMVQRKLGLLQVIDLSATPFFLRGSGYAEGILKRSKPSGRKPSPPAKEAPA